jgi:hypothetical protein
MLQTWIVSDDREVRVKTGSGTGVSGRETRRLSRAVE